MAAQPDLASGTKVIVHVRSGDVEAVLFCRVASCEVVIPRHSADFSGRCKHHQHYQHD